MNVHYINILLFAFPLNILLTLCHENNQRNHNITIYHTSNTKPTKSHRILCECELYTPANYDNDPEMNEVMENFNKQTQQRLHEYDERMKTTRQKCREQCDKEIQRIILKDKLEKELTEKFAILQTDIHSDDIPTCICEKSMADKVEKGCLRCTQNLGGIAAPSSGVLAGIAEGALYAWKPKALEAAITAAKEAGAATGLVEGIEAGKNAVIGSLKKYFFIDELGIGQLDSIFTTKYYFDIENLATVILNRRGEVCGLGAKTLAGDACDRIATNLGLILPNGGYPPPGTNPIVQQLKGLAVKVKKTADYVTKTTTEKVTDELTIEKTGEIAATYMGYQTTIIASIVAIVIIVLIMVIIYLILRYRRKKKMKKKLQYIKLLEE
ncbi:PIR protein, putative [Plasmodium sp.]|nr:PIR protein, putative [Plasmodium sp.]